MKKFLAILLSSVLLISVFAAAIPVSAQEESTIQLDSCDSAEKWTGAVVDTLNYLEGTASFKAVGNNITLSKAGYNLPCKLGINGKKFLELYFYVNDAEDVDENSEISIAMNKSRVARWKFKNIEISDGWNKISLSTLLAGSLTTIDSFSINIISKSSENLMICIDDIAFTDSNEITDLTSVKEVFDRADSFDTTGLSDTVLKRFNWCKDNVKTQHDAEVFSDTLTGIMNEVDKYRAANIFTDRIKIHGRAYYENDGLVMGYGATGFTVRFYGTELRADFGASGLATILNVYVDKDINIYNYDTSISADEALAKYNKDCPNFVLTSTEKRSYTLTSSTGNAIVTGLEEGIHTVTILKRGEPIRTSTGILMGLSVTDGYLLSPPKRSSRTIETIGDSDSAAFGNLTLGTGKDFSPSTQDTTLSYTGYLAAKFGADYSVTAKSGVCLLESDKATEGYMTNNYLYTDCWNSSNPKEYDFASNPSDVVLISLGGNDMGRIQPTEEQFVEGMKKFIRQVRAVNPESIIILEYGIGSGGGGRTAAYQKRAVTEINAEGDNNVYYCPITTGSRTGPAGHPSMSSHKSVADELYTFISNLTGWDSPVKEVYSDPTIENGSFEFSSDYAEEGETVTITTCADTGYALKNGTLSLRSSSGESIPFLENNGVVSFVMPANSVIVSGEFEEAAVMPGDVNGDTFVTTSDALLALQASVGKITLEGNAKIAADVDGHEGITTADALCILQKSVGKIDLFPIEKK